MMKVYSVVCADDCDCGWASGVHILKTFAKESDAIEMVQKLNADEVAKWEDARQRSLLQLQWCLENGTFKIPAGVFPWINCTHDTSCFNTEEKINSEFDGIISRYRSKHSVVSVDVF